MPIRLRLLPVLLGLGGAIAFAANPVEGQILPFRQAEVSAPVPSRLVELKVAEGASVQEGQPLAQLYGRLEELDMQRAKVLLERREFEAKGAKRLFDNKIIPEAKALESRIDLDLARLQYEAAAEQVRLRTILAPFAGVVVARYREVGESVSTTQPLFRLLDLSQVLVACAVEAKSIAGWTLGRKVMVQVPDAPGLGALEGEVTVLDPCADAAGMVRVKVVVPNPEGRIRAGLRAVVELGAAK
jgi:RND family efflux transporter MFP subunit